MAQLFISVGLLVSPSLLYLEGVKSKFKEEIYGRGITVSSTQIKTGRISKVL